MNNAEDIRNLVVEVLNNRGSDKKDWLGGSGFFVSKNLVLTAFHNVQGARELFVRSILHETEKFPAKVLLQGNKDIDLALLEVSNLEMDAPSYQYGEVDQSAPALVGRCWAIGFPKFQERRDEDGWLRDSAQVDGKIPTGDHLKSASLKQPLLTLRVKNSPRPLPSGPVPESEWAGISGAVVFSGNDIVVGVITEHHLPKGESALTVVPITAIDLLPESEATQWWKLLGVDRRVLVRLPEEAPSSLSREERQNRTRLINLVRSIWIDKVLRKSLLESSRIVLGLHGQPDLIENPWRTIVQETDQPARPLLAGTSITDEYDAADGLLILGEPGSGKTTLLLELARDLLDRAKKDDTRLIPVYFNLSSWATRRQPITHWLIEELHEKYRVPLKMGKPWIEDDQLLPLLDGLDEVAAQHRTACIEAINAYRREHSVVPIVVCSRSTEYRDQTRLLQLQKAVVIQPLTAQQIDDYLAKQGRKLDALRTVLCNDPTLQEITTTPLMLSVLMLAYHGKSVEDIQTEEVPTNQQQHVWADYVQSMLRRGGASTTYTPGRTVYWLKWLAQKLIQQNQTVFNIEQMQPDWLASNWRRRFFREMGVKLRIGFISGLIGGVTIPLLLALVGGLLIILIFGRLYGLEAMPAFDYTNIEGLEIVLVSSFASGLIGGIAGGLNTERQPARANIRWLAGIKRKLTIGLSSGLFVGLFSGFVGGIVSGLILLPINGLLDLLGPGPEGEGGILPHLGSISDLVPFLSLGWIGALIGALIGGLIGGLTTQIKPVDDVTWSWVGMRRRLLVGMGSGLLLGIVLEQVVVWTVQPLYEGLSLPIGAISSIAIGIVIGFITSGLTPKIPDGNLTASPKQGIWRFLRSKLVTPKQGIWRTARNSLLIASLYGLSTGLTSGLVVGGLYLWHPDILSYLENTVPSWVGGSTYDKLVEAWAQQVQSLIHSPATIYFYSWFYALTTGISFGLLTGLTFFLVGGLFNGGIACIQHITLRLLLRSAGFIPKNYHRFLDYAAGHILLRKVGGGYIFVHRLLLDYFASSDDLLTQEGQPTNKQLTPPARNSLGLGTLLLTGAAFLLIISGIINVGIGVHQTYVNQISANIEASAIPREAATAIAQDEATALREIATVVATNPYPNYLPGHGILALYDPLSQPGTLYDPPSQPSTWQESQDTSGESCQFLNGGYHIRTSKPSSSYSCFSRSVVGYLPFRCYGALQLQSTEFSCFQGKLSPSPSTFSNFVFEVQMTIIQGDCGGIDFRADPESVRSYHFSLCQDGSYFLYKNEGHNRITELLTLHHNTAIHQGLNQTNLIAIFAEGNTIALYVNRHRIASIQDSSYTQGNLGLAADEDNKPTEMVYSNAKVWIL